MLPAKGRGVFLNINWSGYSCVKLLEVRKEDKAKS